MIDKKTTQSTEQSVVYQEESQGTPGMWMDVSAEYYTARMMGSFKGGRVRRLLSASIADTAAWMTEDGERVITDATKRTMPRAVQEPYTVALVKSVESIADTAGAKPDLHAQIMNIRCATPKDYGINMRIAYQQGHRDARHAAADIANIAAPPAPSVADAAGASEQKPVAYLSTDPREWGGSRIKPQGNFTVPVYGAPQRDHADIQDAKRYRFLRENMRFSSPHGETTTMALRAPITAPTHDIHNDWMGDRFDASVDRTIDAAIAKESGND